MCGFTNGNCVTKRIINSEEIKPVALANYRCTLVWRHQVSHVANQYKILRFKQNLEVMFLLSKHPPPLPSNPDLSTDSNLVQRFRVDLKAFLGLSMPNQYCPAIKSKCLAGLWVRFYGQKHQTSWSLYIQYCPNATLHSLASKYCSRRIIAN